MSEIISAENQVINRLGDKPEISQKTRFKIVPMIVPHNCNRKCGIHAYIHHNDIPDPNVNTVERHDLCDSGTVIIKGYKYAATNGVITFKTIDELIDVVSRINRFESHETIIINRGQYNDSQMFRDAFTTATVYASHGYVFEDNPSVPLLGRVIFRIKQSVFELIDTEELLRKGPVAIASVTITEDSIELDGFTSIEEVTSILKILFLKA